ncbi:MAG: TnpV protein [Firmicutes bacterium]|nr:TnpV protein [Bacillota bacterium]
MKETLFENGIQYSLCGDYYRPDLKLEPESRSIGRWGRMHRDYLKEYRPVVFNQLMLSGNLWAYLADINEQAQRRMEVLVKQMMISEGVTEELKEANQMEWVRRLNSIQNSAEEVIQNQLIFK